MQYLGMGVGGTAAKVKSQGIEIDCILLVMNWTTIEMIVMLQVIENQSPFCSAVGCEFRLC